MTDFLNNKENKGQGMVEYALILVLVAVVVIAALTIMGPQVSSVFGTINGSLMAGGAAAAPTAVPTAVVPTAVPTPASVTVTFNCSVSGWVDVKTMSGTGPDTSFSCTPNAPTSYLVTGRASGTWLQFRNRNSPYTTLYNYTVP